MTGLSRSHVTRLIARHTASGRVRAAVNKRRRFPERYTRADIELLAAVDEAHGTLSDPATAHPPARTGGLPAARVCPSGGDLERPSVQPAPPSAVP